MKIFLNLVIALGLIIFNFSGCTANMHSQIANNNLKASTYNATPKLGDKEIFEALTNQVNKELDSGYIYLSLSTYFSAEKLPGFAHWTRIQAQEEQAHAMLIYDFLTKRGGRVVLCSIDAPPNRFASPLAAIQAADGQEVFITGLIQNISRVAKEYQDKELVSFINWFVKEQVQEEAIMEAMIYKLKLIGNDKSALSKMDKELSSRVFEQPFITIDKDIQ